MRRRQRLQCRLSRRGFTDRRYEVVERDELSRLAPEYAKWTAQPNFSQRRYDAYVAPTGRSAYLLQGDSTKRDTSGKKGQLFTPFRALDRPEAFTRSPYLAHEGKIGIVAVTLVIDYGVYSTTGETKKLKVLPKVDFLRGVTAQACSFADTATLAEYGGPGFRWIRGYRTSLRYETSALSSSSRLLNWRFVPVSFSSSRSTAESRFL